MPKILTFSSEWIAFLVFFGFISLFIGFAEVIRKALRWSAETTRKMVHVLVGILVSLAPFIISDMRLVILLAVIFMIVNYLALKSKAFEGMHATERVSYGTLYFPLAFALLVWIYWDRNPAILLTSMLILAFADTMATVVGERVPAERKFILWSDPKSLAGSTAFFVTAFAVVAIALPWFTLLMGAAPLGLGLILTIAGLTAFFAALTEAVSRQGSDNLTLTLAAAFMMDITLALGREGLLLKLILFIILLGIGLYGMFRLHTLNKSGAVGAFILGSFLYGLAEWVLLVPVLVFFILSSALSKLAERNKQPKSEQEKGSNRDIIQVYANAGIPLIMGLCWFLSGFEDPIWFYAFLGALAAATADTWETEIGSFALRQPRHILNFKQVPRGYSGGVTLMGTLGGFFGAFIIVWSGSWLYSDGIDLQMMLLIALAGFLGSIVDSILGATIQGKFVCVVCGKHTEKHVHCGQATTHIAGWGKMDNDWVNMACTASGAGFLLLFCLL